MRFALLRYLLATLILALFAVPAAGAQTPFETLAFERPVAYLPFVSHASSGTAQSIGSVEEQVVRLTNARRAEAGCPPLTISDRLSSSARGHSRDMADNDFFNHIGSDGSTAFDRMARSGYRYTSAAENIAAGFADAESVVTAWTNSPGHRENMLNCSLREVGVGYAYGAGSQYGHYWTQDFGTP
jgi:uncharacterized protein YkwD